MSRIVPEPAAVIALAIAAIIPFAWHEPVLIALAGFMLLMVVQNRHVAYLITIPWPVIGLSIWLILSLLWSVEPTFSSTAVAKFLILTIVAVLIAIGSEKHGICFGLLLHLLSLSLCSLGC